jgi:hypothetical protein
VKISENRPFWTKIRKVTAAQWSRENRKFQFDPNSTSKDPIRGRDPKMGAKSAQERLTYTHSLFFGQKTVKPEKMSKNDHFFEFENFAQWPQNGAKNVQNRNLTLLHPKWHPFPHLTRN